MTIDELFENYGSNIFCIRTQEGYKLIDFITPLSWEIFPPESPYITLTQQESNYDTKYFTLHSNNISFDNLLKEIINIINFNIDKEKKNSLFKERMADLQKLFLESNYEDLKKITFTK